MMPHAVWLKKLLKIFMNVIDNRGLGGTRLRFASQIKMSAYVISCSYFCNVVQTPRNVDSKR